LIDLLKVAAVMALLNTNEEVGFDNWLPEFVDHAPLTDQYDPAWIYQPE
jgi:hypothetical protein